MTPRPFTSRSTLFAFAAASALAAGGVANAQETPGQARARATTQSLNTAPAESTLNRQTRPAPPPPRPSAPRTTRTLTDVLNETADAEPRSAPPQGVRPPMPAPATTRRAVAPPPATARPVTPRPTAPVVAAVAPPPPAPVPVAVPAGPPSAMTPLPLGYYVKGAMNCNQIWPGEGNVAWLSLTAFTIDFGGCDPGEIIQVTDTSWHEDQRCQTELGGDAGLFSIDYETASATTLKVRTRLPGDTTAQEDLWTHCDADEVPAEARFHPDDKGRPA